MKKILVVLVSLMMVVPAFANTVKQNNYSEELNTETVSDFVNKRTKVTITEVDKATGEVKTTIQKVESGLEAGVASSAKNYIDAKQRTIDTIRAKQQEIATYYDAQIAELESRAEAIKANSQAKTEQQKEVIVSVYTKQAEQLRASKDAMVSRLQNEIDVLQEEINSMR